VGAAQQAPVTIYIISTRTLNSELLAHTLEEGSCEKCEIVSDLSTLLPTISGKQEAPGGAPGSPGRTILLIDCIENDFSEVVNVLSDHGVEPSEDLILAIYNVYSGWGTEEEALKYGIKGFFYKQDGLKLLLKGINAILGKEIWVPREILMRSAMGGLRKKQSAIQEKTGLSMREVDILRLVVSGASNEEIAQRLFISSNTVKTHLYNIYKKIGVSSRLEAASWANKNL
jgi:DNA-binding CsgD family transcriptional regulator